ncbi:hypothetical protein D9613_012267 [Agrocybe pediades]|uniref:Uncharacterized protein n=1 Tax=Agrocybe pediades TaxID=84607 RepID=A0A8H4QEL1_9AGAR|nr:hypothetical protein D9613_012267 [Agrocybe pediades]
MPFVLPIIGSYSATVQLSALALLLLVSYLSRYARQAIGATTAAYLGFKILIPTVAWIIYICKGIAWLGFYIYFFKKAVIYAANTVDFILNDGLEAILKEAAKSNQRG